MNTHTLSPVFARVTAVAGVAGAFFLLVSTVLFISQGNGINDGVLGGTVGIWSVIGMAVGSVGIARLLEARAPTAAPIVGALWLTGLVGGAAFNIQAMYLSKYGNDFLADVGSGSDGDWFGFFAFLPWGWMVPLGFVLTGWLIWRTRVAHSWVGALFALGGILFVSGRPERIEPVAVITDVVILAAFASMAPVLMKAAASESAGERVAAS